MGMFSRVRDLIQANLTGLLDRVEDPAKTVQLVIRDMEEALAEVRMHTARALADLKDIRRMKASRTRRAGEWLEKAEFALSKDREDLARAALLEKRRAERMASELGDEEAELQQQLQGLEGALAGLEEKLREARRRQLGIVSRKRRAHSEKRARQMADGARLHDALLHIEVSEREADLAEGEAQALSLGGGEEWSDLERELHFLRQRHRDNDESGGAP